MSLERPDFINLPWENFPYEDLKKWIVARGEEKKYQIATIVHSMFLVLNGVPFKDAKQRVERSQEACPTRKKRDFTLEILTKIEEALPEHKRASLLCLAIATQQIREEPRMVPFLARQEAIGRRIITSFGLEEAGKLIDFSRELIPKNETSDNLSDSDVLQF